MSTDTSASRRPERSRDLERFITFIDAIVAIAITLLVLPLLLVLSDRVAAVAKAAAVRRRNPTPR